jgi:hypothetical protein
LPSRRGRVELLLLPAPPPHSAVLLPPSAMETGTRRRQLQQNTNLLHNSILKVTLYTTCMHCAQRNMAAGQVQCDTTLAGSSSTRRAGVPSTEYMVSKDGVHHVPGTSSPCYLCEVYGSCCIMNPIAVRSAEQPATSQRGTSDFSATPPCLLLLTFLHHRDGDGQQGICRLKGEVPGHTPLLVNARSSSAAVLCFADDPTTLLL